LTQVRRRLLPPEITGRIERSRRWVSEQTGGMGLRVAAALLIGATLAAVVWTAGVPARSDWRESGGLASLPAGKSGVDPVESSYMVSRAPGSPSVMTAQAVAPTSERRISLDLAEACLTGVRSSLPLSGLPVTHSAAYSVADLARLNCCTRCHHALAESSHPRATAAVARSCEICHR